jgi:hypothetical protein
VRSRLASNAFVEGIRHRMPGAKMGRLASAENPPPHETSRKLGRLRNFGSAQHSGAVSGVRMVDSNSLSADERAEFEREYQALLDAGRTRDGRGTWHLCDDCGLNTQEIGEQYMLHNSVWTAATGVSHKWMAMIGFLCIGCIERRLGRQLTNADFSDVGINKDRRPRSSRLRARLRK